MPLTGLVSWQQAKTPTSPIPVPRSLNVHAPAFVPKLRAAAQVASSTLTASRSNGAVCSQHAEADPARPAVPPTISPCSTSGRESLTHTSQCFGRSAVFSQRPRDVRAYAAAAAAADTSLQAGCIVEFKTDSRQDLALLQRPNGKANWFATDVRGQTYSLRPQQMVYILPGESYKESDLHQIHDQALKDADVALLADAWEMVHDDDELYSVTEMASLLFGNEEPRSCYASHRLLSQERIFFKQAGRSPPRFQARSAKEVHLLKAKRIADEKAATEVQEFVQEMYRADTADSTLAIQMMQACGKQPNPSAAVEMLQSAGWWRPHEQLGLIKAQRTETFPSPVQERAAQLLTEPPTDPDASIRQDLTHHEVLTIDDASTRDIDDGLAVEVLPDGRHKLWVHIADPTRWVMQGDPLDVEARHRAKTMYLPTGNIPMFPRDLADGLFSLHLGQPTAALSVHMVLNSDGSLDECGIVASTVSPTRKLTYHEVDELLDATMPEQEPMLWALHQAAEARERWREEQGAMSFQMPEAKVRVVQPHSPASIVQVHASSCATGTQPSQRLVSEMMILTGQAIAHIGSENGLALPYRGQVTPSLPSEQELQALPSGPCRHVLLRSKMVRGNITTSGPTPHAALGLQGYVQFTSPIRRYSDMLAHFQLKAFLRGESAPFTAFHLGELVDMSNGMAQEAAVLEREVTNYWLAHYFRAESENNPERSWKAMLLMWMRTESGLARILMPDLGLETVMRINRPAKPGDELDICVAFIDVPKGIYKFNEAAFGQPVNSQDVDRQDELDPNEDGEADGEADIAVSESSDPAEADTAVDTS
ncbi:hypothetical protein WJX79_005355 [Trebouxia sp. C0005]